MEEDAKNMEREAGRGPGDAYMREDEETCFLNDPTGFGGIKLGPTRTATLDNPPRQGVSFLRHTLQAGTMDLPDKNR